VTLPPALRALANRVLGWSPVRTTRRVLDAYGAAGGGLLAGGLTYSALFALLPSLLLLTGILGFVVDDPERRVAIVRGIGQALPPLQGLVASSLDEITDNATGLGTVGLIGLAWGASHFYGSLDDAFARIFQDDRRRGFLVRTLRGLLSVVLLVTVFIAALVLTGLASYLAAETASRFGDGTQTFWQFASPVLAAIVFIAATAAVYRLVPARPSPWRAIGPPAVVAGIALTLLTQLFSYIAPRLIGIGSVYVAFVAIFAAMVWLSMGFQILLLGAAWAKDRLVAMPETAPQRPDPQVSPGASRSGDRTAP
jgi:membrane protein